jgi:hypothetical protein
MSDESEIIKWCIDNFATIKFSRVQGYNRVVLQVPGYAPVERYTLQEAYSELSKRVDDRRTCNDK